MGNQNRDEWDRRNQSNQQQGAGEAGGGRQQGQGDMGQQNRQQGGGGQQSNRQQQQQGGERQGQTAKDDGITRDDINAGNDLNQPGQMGNQDRERSGSTRSRNP